MKLREGWATNVSWKHVSRFGWTVEVVCWRGQDTPLPSAGSVGWARGEWTWNLYLYVRPECTLYGRLNLDALDCGAPELPHYPDFFRMKTESRRGHPGGSCFVLGNDYNHSGQERHAFVGPDEHNWEVFRDADALIAYMNEKRWEVQA